MAVTAEFVRAALTQIDTGHGGSLVAKGWVGDVVARDGHVLVTIDVPADLGATLEPIREAAEKAIYRLSGVTSATVVLTGGEAGTRPAAGDPSCSVPEAQAAPSGAPTPIDEMIAAVRQLAAGHPDGAANFIALGSRKNFPPKLAELARALAPVVIPPGRQA